MLTPHTYRGDGIPDHHGEDRCLDCRLGRRHPVHVLPLVDPDVAQVQQRILGEHDDNTG